MNLEDLGNKFAPEDLEWRIQQSGIKSGRPWALVLAYVTNRAIEDRLDEVVGMENWRNEFKPAPDGGVLCGISIRIEREDYFEWVTKWDGAENTEIESVKGGLSSSMKRAGQQWSIGRYLYNLPVGWAVIAENGRLKGKATEGKGGQPVWFKWNPPELPDWALPGSTEEGTAETKKDPEFDIPPPIEEESEKDIKDFYPDYEVREEKKTDITINQVNAIKKILTGEGMTDDHLQCETVTALAGLPEMIGKIEDLTKKEASVVIGKLQDKKK